MNPIHESGPATILLLLFCGMLACVPALTAVIARLFEARRLGLGAAVFALIGVVAIFGLAAYATHRLHRTVDYWIDQGSYGPPAEVRAQYGQGWHESASITAWVGLVAGGIPGTIAALGWWLSREAGGLRKNEIVVMAMVVSSAASCAVMAL